MRHLLTKLFNRLKVTILLLFVILLFICCSLHKKKTEKNSERPNILMVITDDQSYPFASAYGSKMVFTPSFDLVANSGVSFTNAFVTSPGCSPSRASMLTGRYPWQIEEAGTHASSFPSKYITYPSLFEKHGYKIGYTGKGWAPGNWEVSGRNCNPAGYEYNDIRLTPPTVGISDNDYTSNFQQFLREKESNLPFCFWVGFKEPHRVFEKGSAIKNGKNLDDAEVPAFLPNTKVVKSDVLDFAYEIEWADKHLGHIIDILKKNGEFENTIILVTSDNGMAFPRAKANCYDAGIHVPLAICWGDKIFNRKIDNVFSTVHLMPTLLEATQVKFPINKFPMEGESILSFLLGRKNFSRAFGEAYSGRERHTYARFNNLGYPIRSLRTENFLLIRNFTPDRHPAGDSTLMDSKTNKLLPLIDNFCDVDQSPSKEFLIMNRKDEDLNKYYAMSFGKRPKWELYDIINDSACATNIYGLPKYKEISDRLSQKLENKLKKSGALEWIPINLIFMKPIRDWLGK